MHRRSNYTYYNELPTTLKNNSARSFLIRSGTGSGRNVFPIYPPSIVHGELGAVLCTLACPHHPAPLPTEPNFIPTYLVTKKKSLHPRLSLQVGFQSKANNGQTAVPCQSLFISMLHNKLRVQQALFFGLAYQGKDIVS